MNEQQVAAELESSRVFLAFSDFEGCPVPPLEAALSGNVVVGYPGWGGREYWDAPNFHSVPVGDMRAWVEQFRIAAAWSLREDAQAQLAPGIASLKAAYGLQAEIQLLKKAFAVIDGLAAPQPPAAQPSAIAA